MPLDLEHFLQCGSPVARPVSIWMEPSLDLSVLRDKIVFVGRRTAKLAMEL
jgi:hypothetical protein